MLSYKSMCKLILLHRLMRRCNQPKHLNATRVLFKFISIWDPMQTLMLHKLFWLPSHLNITLCMIWYYWTTKFILEIPQFKICKNKLKFVLEIAKQKTGIKRNEMKQKKMEITYLAASQPRGPTTRPNPTKPGHLPFREGVIIFLPEMEAARWSSLSHPIHRRLLDAGDEGRRPRSAIKKLSTFEETLEIAPSSLSRVYLQEPETLAPVELVCRWWRSPRWPWSSPGAPPCFQDHVCWRNRAVSARARQIWPFPSAVSRWDWWNQARFCQLSLSSTFQGESRWASASLDTLTWA
jgi:hypothetical protein